MPGFGEAITVTLIFLAGLVAFATDRVRHDLVALLMLLVAVLVGVVAADEAFKGFADPVVVTVAAVMVLSGAISRSGVLTHALRPFRRWMHSETGVAIIYSSLCCTASAFMNNVGALALVLPAAIATCRSSKISPSRILMPMAFASLLGGLVTLIGTPPNVILAGIRTDYGKPAFQMFDFTWVGLPLAIVGLAMTVLLVRFLPRRAASEGDPLKFRVADYLFELRVTRRAKSSLTVGQLEAAPSEEDRLIVHAIDRGGLLVTAPAGSRELLRGDIIQVEGRAPIVEQALERFGLELASEAGDDLLEGAFVECVVTDHSSLLLEESATEPLAEHGASLVAVSRRGKSLASGLSSLKLQQGDVLLLQITPNRIADVAQIFDLLPLAERSLNLRAAANDWLPLMALLGAIVAASTGLTNLAVSLILGVTVLGLTGRLTGKTYADIDWPIIVLLGALIPVAEAFGNSGAGNTVANMISNVGSGKPTWVMIALALGLTMAITPFLNNAAAVLIMGPIAAQTGLETGVPIDAMLMAVAIGASCDFLTPIGHQSNTLVWGPGGYRFSDYARVGTPLSVLVLLFGTFLIDTFWA